MDDAVTPTVWPGWQFVKRSFLR